jgi:two-component system CheB/CheR fusion protein
LCDPVNIGLAFPIMDMHKPEQATPTTGATTHLAFPIVGIGASAGGFPALALLLQALPASPGMALVIVLHLPADQQSSADRILQRSTRLPVVQVDHATPILPDHIYIIPPARSLRMEDGHLILHELDRVTGDPATIDVFFRTLAMAHREKAIGVILSGMGSDGSAGLACIKEQGGVTLVQVPAEAEQPSMPQSAIDAGMADFVLAAARMPDKLIELRGITQTIRAQAMRGHAPAEVCFDMGPDPERTLQDVLALLHAHTGHDFRHYRRATLLRRLERRLQVRGRPDLPSYHALQRQDPSESQALLKDLLIGVTQFFRDRAAFAVLEHTVLPHLFQGKGPGDTVRVWVAACSTGEEAYSMAMLLADHAATMADPPAIQVFGSDIDAQAIRTARAALYPASIVEDIPPDRLQRYFTVENGAYKVRKALRRQVLFAEHNLLHDPAFSSLDLISCRNFLIYLNQEMHRQVLGTFHFALRPDGYLMLGSAETADDASDLFAALDTRMRIYRTRLGPQAARPPVAAPVHKVWRAPARPIERHEAPPVAHRSRLFSFAEIHLHKVAGQAPPSILVDGIGQIVHIAPEASRFLRHAGGEPTRDLVALVPPAWRLALRTALFQARKSGRHASTGPVRYEEAAEQRALDMTVQPFHDEHAEGLLMLVSFKAIQDAPESAVRVDPREQPLLEQLEAELSQTRHKLLDTIDQAEQSDAALRTTMEELKTTVEELRSANRQLEAALEKAHVANEELGSTNADLTQRLGSLAKSHDDLNNLIASSDVATLFLDREMRIQRYTPRIAELFNVIPADVGRPLLHITSRLENAHLAEAATGVFETLQPLELEVRSKDGRDYIVRVHPYRTSSHRIDGAVMSVFDITSRRIAEKALRESEKRLALAFAAVPVGICTVDTAGNTVMLNDVMRRFMPTGTIPSREPAQAPRWRGWDVAGAPVQPHDFPGARALRGEDVLAGMQMLYMEGDDKETWTEVRAQPLRDGEGRIAGALVVVIDVDRLKRSEEAARQGAQRHAFLLKLGDALRVQPDEQSIREQAVGMLAEHLRRDRCWISEAVGEQGMSMVGPERIRPGLAPPRPWSDGERMLLEEVAERTWSAIERMRAERRAENILEHMGDAHSVLDRDYRIVGVNAAAEHLLGRPRTELLGHACWDAVPGSARAPVAQNIRRVVEQGVEQHFTHHYTGEGHDFHFEVDAYPTDEGGVAMFWRDVTEPLRAAQALQASEEKYRALFNEMDEAFAVVEVMADEGGRWTDFLFLDANPAFMRHTGMPYPVGRTATQLLGTPNPHWAELYGRAVETGVAIHVEEGELTLGRVFDLNIFRMGEGGSRRVAVLFRDVSEKRRTQEALRRSEERYRMLFEASPLPFIVTRPDAPHFTVVGVNDAYLAATLRTRASLLGHRIFDAFPDDPAHGVSSVLRASFERVLATRQQDMMPVMKYDMLRPDGTFEERWWIPLQSPVLDDAGQVTAIIHSATDITDIHRAQVALRASEERQAFLLKLSDAVRALTSVEEIQSVTDRMLGTHLGVDRVMFAEVAGEPGAETGFIRTQFIRQADPGRASLAPFLERFDYRSFGEHAMAIRYRGDLLIVADIDAGPDFMASERAAWAAAGVKAAIVVPLARGGRLIAEFGVQSATPRDWTEAEVSLVRDVGERTLAAVERAVTAEALQESEARFRALAEASPALIWQIDAGGALNYVNGRCLAVLGASLEQLRGAGWHGILHPHDAAGYLAVLARALDGQDAFQQRVRVRTRDGGYRWFASYALPWHTADGQFQGMVGISIDVEEAVEPVDA